MRRRHLLLLAVLIAFQHFARTSSAPPEILSVVIPGIINVDGSGSYLQLLKESLKLNEKEITILPTKRALKYFSNASEATCLFPLDRNSAESLGVDIRNKTFSKPFNTSFAAILSQQGEKPIQSLQDLNSHSIGVVHGFPIADEVVGMASSIVKPNSLEALLQMLERGRIDFAYVHFPDLLLSYSQTGISPFPESSLRFQEVGDALACTDDASAWISEFNQAIDVMYKNNTIRSALGAAFTGRQ